MDKHLRKNTEKIEQRPANMLNRKAQLMFYISAKTPRFQV